MLLEAFLHSHSLKPCARAPVSKADVDLHYFTVNYYAPFPPPSVWTSLYSLYGGGEHWWISLYSHYGGGEHWWQEGFLWSHSWIQSAIAQGSELKCIPVIGLQVIKSINNVPVCLKQCAPLPPSSEAASFVFLPYR